MQVLTSVEYIQMTVGRVAHIACIYHISALQQPILYSRQQQHRQHRFVSSVYVCNRQKFHTEQGPYSTSITTIHYSLVPHHLRIQGHRVEALLRPKFSAEVHQSLRRADQRGGDTHRHYRGALVVGKAAHVVVVHDLGGLGGLGAHVQGEVRHQHAVAVHLQHITITYNTTTLISIQDCIYLSSTAFEESPRAIRRVDALRAVPAGLRKADVPVLPICTGSTSHTHEYIHRY